MAKGEAKKVNRGYTDEANRINQEGGKLSDQLYSRVPGATDRADTSYNTAYKGYNDILDDPEYGTGGYGDGGGGYGEYEQMFRGLGGPNGGLSDENINRIRGKGVFDEFSKTGGFSPEDIANVRSQATEANSARFEALRNKMEQLQRVSGSGPSYGASESRLARDQSREGNTALLDANVGIKNAVNEGRRWGTSSLSGAEQGLSELQSRNRIAGAEGGLRARNMGADDSFRRASLASGNRLAALGGIRGLRTDQPGEEFGLYDRINENNKTRGSLYGNNQQGYAGYNPNVSAWDRVMQLGGLAANGAASYFGGGSNPFKKKKGGVQALSPGKNYGSLNTWG